MKEPGQLRQCSDYLTVWTTRKSPSHSRQRPKDVSLSKDRSALGPKLPHRPYGRRILRG